MLHNASAVEADDGDVPPPPPTPPQPCGNCATALQGPFCHVCGQPRNGLIRNFSTVVGDVLDTTLAYDGRVWRTLGPLLWSPGALSLAFFQGQRVRYVSPFRLFFFLAVFAFFAAQLNLRVALNEPDDGAGVAELSSALTLQELEVRRAQALAALDARLDALADRPDTVAARARLQAARTRVEVEASRRHEVLEGVAAGHAPPVEDSAPMRFNERDWHALENPLQVDWLPGWGNRWLNVALGRIDQNYHRIRQDPKLLTDAFLSSLPLTLVVLLPGFALLLKLVYLFQRRLYMEHLVVGLHSHAFLCAALLVLVMLNAGADADVPGWAARALGWGQMLVAAWMPVYLLLMQKRIYRQGWGMTMVKYAFLGVCYLSLLGLGATTTLLLNFISL